MWYYIGNGQQQGPFDDPRLDALITAGAVTPETPVWKEGQGNWLLLRQARVGAGVCQVCCRAVGEEHIMELDGTRVCASCKPIALQKIREGVALVPSDKRERPVLVWIISIFYFVTIPLGLLSVIGVFWMIHSNAIPMQEEQRKLLASKGVFDYALSFFGMILNFLAALNLFRLKRQAFPYFASILVLTVLNLLYQILFRNWLTLVGSTSIGMISAVIGIAVSFGISGGITYYAWYLREKQILR